MSHILKRLIVAVVTAFCLLVVSCIDICADHPSDNSMKGKTVGLIINNPGTFPGYTLFSPMRYNRTYLINNEGNIVHEWDSDSTPLGASYLLENGNIFRGANTKVGTRIQIIDWNGTLVWNYTCPGAHHDYKALTNGNILIIMKDFKNRSEAIAAGRDPGLIRYNSLQSERIIEVQPTGLTTGIIVWEWRLWDHLIQDYDHNKANFGVVGDHPELLDLNYALSGDADWIHANAIDYNPDSDQIAISSRLMSEIWIIDHSTTSAEASTHSGGKQGMGGDFLYRWGNPRVYRTGDIRDKKFFGQHDVQWIKPGLARAGNIMVFNNGFNRPGGSLYSTIDEITPPVGTDGSYTKPPPRTAFEPTVQSWLYNATPSTDFYSGIQGGCQRLANGDTLVCSSAHGIFFEISMTKTIVWKYINPVNLSGPANQGNNPTDNDVFRCYRYPFDHPGLQGKNLTPIGPIEHYPVTELNFAGVFLLYFGFIIMAANIVNKKRKQI